MASLHKHAASPYWYCAYYLPDGRRTLRSTKTSDKRKALGICLKYEEAARLGREGRLTEARAREVIADIYAIANADKLPSSTVKAYLASWLSKKSLEVAASSYVEYERTVNDFLEYIGERGNRVIDSITPRDIAGYRGHLAKRIAGATVNKTLKILRGAWTQAVRESLARENIFAKVDLVKETKPTRRGFTLDELRGILAACNAEWRGMVLVGLYTGQRLSDIASLTWRNVDLAEGGIRFTTRKTDRPMAIPIAKPLMKHLLTLNAPDNPGTPVFPEAAEAVKVNQSTLSRQFTDILAIVGLAEKKTHEKTGKGRDARRESKGPSFHSLRHTATSLLKNAGVSDVVAREIIGHESEAISRVYTHIEKPTLKKALDKLPDLVN